MTTTLFKVSRRGRQAVVVRLRSLGRERGDVPGWVMITLMTAGLVAILMGLAKPQLAAMFQRAMDMVNG
jgi:predicted lysophospholipase L1 biosynthesis ABC-type transport system permease subunit